MTMDPSESPSAYVEKRIDFAAIKDSIKAKKFSKLAVLIPVIFGVVGMYLYIDGRTKSHQKAQQAYDESVEKPKKKADQDIEDIMSDINRRLPDSGPVVEKEPIPTGGGEPTDQHVPMDEENQLTESDAKVLKKVAEELSKYRILNLMEKIKSRDAALKSASTVKFKRKGEMDSVSGKPSPTTANQADSLLRNLEALQNGNNQPAAGSPTTKDSKLAYTEAAKRYGYLPETKKKPISPYEVKASTVIPGIMVTGINSDLPAEIVGVVSQNIYDTATGEHLLIPRGTKLMGDYHSDITWGQERVLVAWRRMIFPNGATLNILNMSGVDQQGYGGLGDEVDNHYFRIFGSAMLIGVIRGANTYVKDSRRGDKNSSEAAKAGDAVADGVSEDLANLSNQMLAKNLGIAPTLKIRPGYRFNIMVNKDMVLEPYIDED